MGTYCSINKEEDRHVEKASQGLRRGPSKLVKKHLHDPSAGPVTDTHHSTAGDAAAAAMDSATQYDNVESLDAFLRERDKEQFSSPPNISAAVKRPRRYYKGDSRSTPAEAAADLKAYSGMRDAIAQREAALAFDWACRQKATAKELQADRVIQDLKLRDRRFVYGEEMSHRAVDSDGMEIEDRVDIPPRRGYGGQAHPRFYGDHFLCNVELIGRTKLFKVARAMPKGAHLHIHFNANLEPGFLLGIAKEMDHMYITSDRPLVSHDDFDLCEIQFSIISKRRIREENRSRTQEQPGEGNLFSKDYGHGMRERMQFRAFLRAFEHEYRRVMGQHDSETRRRLEEAEKRCRETGKPIVDHWLEEKLMFHEEETHNSLQTPKGAWEKFNGRTRMMKGLFNYETAYRKYTRKCLEEFEKENIQYAEIRPNFMSTNQVWLDDGSGQLENIDIMRIFKDEYDKFQRENGRYFMGLKIIYCTPRSFEPLAVKDALEECGEFYLSKEFEGLIAGFDLVGEEGADKYPLKHFIPQFLEFRKRFSSEEIPFLFHCGETLEMGNDTDGNLVDALLLDSRRIGHGFALARHPYVMEQMKKRGVCVELCPISNEILGLTPRVNGHSMYNLLANNVHCTVSSDNPTLFRSSLSHDFYQVMAGKEDMTLFGWKQLVEWSLEHSRMDEAQKAKVFEAWRMHWASFVDWICRTDWRLPVESIELPEQLVTG